MAAFLGRYRQGEFEQVWDDLLVLGERVRHRSILDDAMAVSREFARRAWHNAEIIHRRLIDLGYLFARPDAALVPAGPQSVAAADQIEAEIGVLPLSLRAWYEVFDSLDFAQHVSQRFPPVSSPVCGLGEQCSLIVHSPRTALEDWRKRLCLFQQPDDATLRFWESVGGKPSEPDRFLRTGGDNTSCDPRGMTLPELRADGLMDEGHEHIYFVAMIRRCFQWGGFPGCKHWLNGKSPVSGVLARPDDERLIPLLQTGLQPL